MFLSSHFKFLVLKNFFFKRVIQLSTLEDSNVPNKEQWDDAIKFMEETLMRESELTEIELSGLIGPGWRERFLYWTNRTKEQVLFFSLLQIY